MSTSQFSAASEASLGGSARKSVIPLAGAVEGAPRQLLRTLENFVRENPSQAALWCFGIGFVLGWKMKPW